MTLHHVRLGSGPPLVLVHGLGASWQSWEPLFPALSAQREVIALDLPGFGESPPLPGEVSIATLTDALSGFLDEQGLRDASLVGSSMGARMVMELARRGVGGDVVALDPGGFWTDRQRTFFATTLRASIALVQHIQPLLPALTASPVGRTALLAQFSARPWALPKELVLRELRGYSTAPSMGPAFDALAHGPLQVGAPAGSLPGRLTIGWGRHDKVTLPSQAATAIALFPDAQLHWFEHSGHFPLWDEPGPTAATVLAATS